MTTTGAENGSHSNELSIFHDVAKALTSSLNLDTVLQRIMQKMAAYFEPATWALLMVDEDSGELYLAVSVGTHCEYASELRLTSGEPLSKWVISTGQALVIGDVTTDSRIAASSRTQCVADRCGVVCMPVLSGGDVMGVIQLVDVNMETYTRNELLLRTLADYAAIAIQNARAVRRIQELSITDDCTALYNARHLFTVLAEEVHRSARFGYEFSLIFLDIDHFKDVNDGYGHLAGSKLLGMVGQLLRENLRLVDAAFRYGGDEFALVLPQTSKMAALLVARRISAAFHSRTWTVGEERGLQLRASIGIAGYPEDGSTPQAIVQSADEMMYTVKQAGRDNIAVSGMGVVGRSEPQ